MKVLYDSLIFDCQRYGGASKCFSEVMDAFPSDVSYECTMRLTKNVHLLEKGLFKEDALHRNWERFRFVLSTLGKTSPSILNINRDYTIKKLKKGDFDVFHHTFSDDYFLPYLNGKPFVYTIHDMIPELYPEWFPNDTGWVRCRRNLCEKADAIIAISQNTKKDLVDLFGIEPNKVTVVYHGGPEKRVCNEAPIVEGSYFLFVGTRIRYKNFSIVLKALSSFCKNKGDTKLICTGMPFSDSEKEEIKGYGLDSLVSQLFVSDAELVNLYSNATAFIYPSLYEGFGLPILEAFSCGCPAILSNCSCFPEIGADAALYFEGNGDGEDLYSLMEKVANMTKEERTNLIERGFKRLSHFTWERSAAELCEVYKSLV